MEDSTISSILYFFGILIIIISHTYMLVRNSIGDSSPDINTHVVVNFGAVILLIAAWVLEMKVRKEKEKWSENGNNLNYALQSGVPIAGTVYSDCPGCSPGLGWVL